VQTLTEATPANKVKDGLAKPLLFCGHAVQSRVTMAVYGRPICHPSPQRCNMARRPRWRLHPQQEKAATKQSSVPICSPVYTPPSSIDIAVASAWRQLSATGTARKLQQAPPPTPARLRTPLQDCCPVLRFSSPQGGARSLTLVSNMVPTCDPILRNPQHVATGCAAHASTSCAHASCSAHKLQDVPPP
jgi:hypothetical protein